MDQVEQTGSDEVEFDAPDDDFDAGFSGDAAAPTTTPDEVAEPEPIQDLAPEAPAPELATITKDQFDDLLRKAASIDEMRAENKRLSDTVFGKIGGMQQSLAQLQSHGAVEISDDDFAFTREAFPELAVMIGDDMKKVVGKLRGTGQATPFDPAQVEQLIAQRLDPALQKVTVDYETKLLRAYHPDWKQVVNSEDFRKWGQSLPPGELQAMNDSNDANFLADRIAAFKAVKPSAPPPSTKVVATRQTRLAAAVAPRGTGGHPSGPTELDDFEQGFNS